MGQHNRRSCCKGSKVPQILVIFHFLNRAMLFGSGCLRAYLQLGSNEREDVGTQDLGIVRTRKNMQKLEVLSCWECRVRLENITKFLGFMVSSQPRPEHRIPIVVFWGCMSVQSSGFLVLMPERTPAKTRGFVVCECGEVLQYIRKTLRFTVYLLQKRRVTGICSTSYTSRKRDYRLSWLLAVLGFVSCHQHDVIMMMTSP